MSCCISDTFLSSHYSFSLSSLSNTYFSSTSENQTFNLNNAAYKDIISTYSHEVKEKSDTDNRYNRDKFKQDENQIATDSLAFQDFFKYMTYIADLDEKIKITLRLEKIQQTDQSIHSSCYIQCLIIIKRFNQ